MANEFLTRAESARLRRLAYSIIKRLRTSGHSAFLVGGCVRDMLLNSTPPDYDIASSATPQEIRTLFPNVIPVGEQFGVMIVLIEGAQFQVAQYRTDIGIQDGRHPKRVEATDARGDVLRRDFTINGLLYDPAKKCVIDYVGGRRDLGRRLIRAIGDPELRFEEDKLRMLRAIRFAARLNFKIEPATWKAILRRAKEIAVVSEERIREELTRMLTQGNADRAFRLLERSGLLSELLPEIQALKGVPQPKHFHPEGDVWIHTLLMLSLMKKPTVELAWGVLLHDVGKPPTLTRTDRIRFNNHAFVGAQMSDLLLRRLKFSNREIDVISALVRDHMKFVDLPQMRESTRQRFLRDPLFPLHLELHRLDCLGSHRDLSLYRLSRRLHAQLKKERPTVPRLITGHDLLALGLRPSKRVGSILQAIEDLQLEQEIGNREEALALAEQLAADELILAPPERPILAEADPG